MRIGGHLRLAAKRALAPILYRHRPIGLSAGKLYLFLDALYRTRHLSGDVVEMGCNVCGTAALGWQMLGKLRSDRGYLCIDTFSGFVAEQHEADVALGNAGEKVTSFEANDIRLARRVLNLHRARGVRLLQADVCSVQPPALPLAVSVCLLDVDLYEPTKAGLTLVWPRMQPGGIILVDDCAVDSKTWQAARALEEFAEAQSAPFRIEFGMGVISVSADSTL